MSESKHTPGPWEVAYHDKHGQAVVQGEHTEICTCWHHSVGSLEKEMEANARLIAAAPELLAALEALAVLEVKGHAIIDRLSFSSEGRELQTQVLAAIAKAKGEAA